MTRLEAGRDGVGLCMFAPPQMMLVSAQGAMAPVRPVVGKDEHCASHVHVSPSAAGMVLS